MKSYLEYLNEAKGDWKKPSSKYSQDKLKNPKVQAAIKAAHERDDKKEKLDELNMSHKTYVSAMQRTTGYDSDYSGEGGRIDTDKLIARAKKNKGEKFAKDLAGADQMTERPNRNKVSGQWGNDQLAWREPVRKTKDGKANKQDVKKRKSELSPGDYRKPRFKKRALPEETTNESVIGALAAGGALGGLASAGISAALYGKYGKKRKSVADRLLDTHSEKSYQKYRMSQADSSLKRATKPKTIERLNKDKADAEGKLKKASYWKSLLPEEQLNEISSKLASNYLKGNYKQVTDKKGIKLRKAYKRADGRELAIDKLSGRAKVNTTEENLQELHGKGSLEKIRDFHKKKVTELGKRANRVADTADDRRSKTKSTVVVYHNDGKKTRIPGHGEDELRSVERNRDTLFSKRALASMTVKRATGLIKKRESMKEETLNELRGIKDPKKRAEYIKNAKADKDLAISDREHYKKNLTDKDREWTKGLSINHYKTAVERNSRAMKRKKYIDKAENLQELRKPKSDAKMKKFIPAANKAAEDAAAKKYYDKYDAEKDARKAVQKEKTPEARDKAAEAKAERIKAASRVMRFQKLNSKKK